MLELAKNISQLDKAADLLEEVIIVNNASTEDYSELKEFLKANPEIPFRYFDAPVNLGVAKGRNFALQKGSAPIVIMLDDDALLKNKDSLVNLLEEFDTKNTDRPKAIVSFKVLYLENLQMQVNAFPHKKFDDLSDRSFFQTYYYAGGAHAIKREVISKIGLYPEDFFYGMEEYDLAYRILDQGYSIVYSDKIIMLHKESPLGRQPKKETLKMMWLNKTKVAWRHLPKKYFYSTALMWSLQYLRKSRFDLKGFFAGWQNIFSISSSEKRTPVNKSSLDYLKHVDARLWY
jgi:GT2 family glycosyltransferase